MRYPNPLATALIAGALLTLGCQSHSGRVKTEGEGDLVGSRKAGAETYKRLIAETTRKLLDSAAEDAQRRGKAVIAFIGVENRSAEELGDVTESTYEMVDTTIIESGVFKSISRRFVDAAMMETGQRPESLFLAGGLERFTRVLRRDGHAPDYLLWAKYTSMSTGGEGVAQRDYLLTLELVDAASGETVHKNSAIVTKEYTR